MARKTAASLFGISWEDSHGHTGWRAQCRGRKLDSLGESKPCKWPLRFGDPAEAARVYDVMAIYLKGPDARLNFDGRPPVGMTRAEIRIYLEGQGFVRPGAQEPRRFSEVPLI